MLECRAVGVRARGGRAKEGGGVGWAQVSGGATVLAVDWSNGIKVGSSGAAHWLLPAAQRRVI